MNARDLPYQPVIAGALALNGFTPEDVLAEKEWLSNRNPFTTSATAMDKPFMLFDADGGSIDWGRNGIEFRFRRCRGGYSFTMFIQTVALPESVIAGMAGRLLSDVIDIAGAESFTVALVKLDDDGAGYTLGLERVGDFKEEPDI